ncbi:MAG: selenocysteine synthase [Bacteroidota bacterium]
MKRRDLIKYLSVAPIAGAAVGTGIPFAAEAAEAAPAKAKRDVIKELGLRTFINAAGTYTTMTASLMHEEVVDTINESAKHFVMINEVQDKVGEKIAAICHAESAMVTAGCWSALVLGTAGVLTRMDRKKVGLLPDVSTFDKNEVIVQTSHNVGYVHALTNTGIKPVVVTTAEELERAIGPKTAMMYFLNAVAPEGKIQHQEFVAIAKKHNIPTLIDIAADIPPVENLWKYTDMGFDLTCISGGKAIRGPQSAGLLIGKKDLIAAARLSAPPSGGNIGRGMKVNKEEILGMYVALDKYVNQDHDKEWKEWEAQVATITSAVKKVNGVNAVVSVPEIANHTPKIAISWDQSKVKATPRQIMKNLQDGSPSIETMGGRDTIDITVFMLKPGEEKIVAKRLQEELSRAAVS